MSKGDASNLLSKVRATQGKYTLVRHFLPAVLLWVTCCGGCGCPEWYISNRVPPLGENIAITIEQTGFPDQWSAPPYVGLAYEPPRNNGASVTFTVENLACVQGVLSISLSFRVGEPRVRSYKITWSPYDCPGLDANFYDVTDANIQCEIASTWDKENLVMSISIDYCEIEVLGIWYWGEGDSPSIQRISIQGTHTFQMERGLCR